MQHVVDGSESLELMTETDAGSESTESESSSSSEGKRGRHRDIVIVVLTVLLTLASSLVVDRIQDKRNDADKAAKQKAAARLVGSQLFSAVGSLERGQLAYFRMAAMMQTIKRPGAVNRPGFVEALQSSFGQLGRLPTKPLPVPRDEDLRVYFESDDVSADDWQAMVNAKEAIIRFNEGARERKRGISKGSLKTRIAAARSAHCESDSTVSFLSGPMRRATEVAGRPSYLEGPWLSAVDPAKLELNGVPLNELDATTSDRSCDPPEEPWPPVARDAPPG